VNQYTGWLLDVYAHPQRGVTLWLLCDDGRRLRLQQDFPVSFYAAGPPQRLRQLWTCLRSMGALEGAIHESPLQASPSPTFTLAREERRDLFTGTIPVLAARTESPAALSRLYSRLTGQFLDLTFYDADVHIAIRHAAVYGTFPLARVALEADENGSVQELVVLDSPWHLDPERPELRVMSLEPEEDPFHSDPQRFIVQTTRGRLALDLPGTPEGDSPATLGLLGHLIKQYDPDLILTAHGDTWLLPRLLEQAHKAGRDLPFNRDPDADIQYKKARSYFAYNQVIYRGNQVHLAGRWHLDINNTVMYKDYGIDGVLEMARVTSLPVQTAARVSPGTGISSMQIITALRQGILVPLRKEQIERPKTTTELLRADTGGMIFDPITGLHQDVAEVDFASMYPSIMVRFNVSPETVGTQRPTAELVPELGVIVDRQHPGLIPQTLAPLLEKRLALKDQLLSLPQWDSRYKTYKAQASAHKWLTVTCFGYLGYKNARFGKIEAHEAVTAFGREVMLRAKEAAEEAGFTVLHLYVDGMWIKKPGCRQPRDFLPLLKEIEGRTGLRIALDGVFKWVVFLPSRVDRRLAVPNRYFGVFQNGEVKARGIEVRRHDTSPFVSETQGQILEMLVNVFDGEGGSGNQPPPSLPQIHKHDDYDHYGIGSRMFIASEQRCISGFGGGARRAEGVYEAIHLLVQSKLTDLRLGRVPLEKLLVRMTVSRNLKEFRSTRTPVAAALLQLEAAGKSLRPGQNVRILYTLGRPGARAWDLPERPDPRTVNVARYKTLLLRAVQAVMEEFEAVFVQEPIASPLDILWLSDFQSAVNLGEMLRERPNIYSPTV
jgi:DNA polymerase-2